MSCLVTFQKKLEESSGKKLKLKINNNRSTMLSVKWEPDFAKVSMHRMFLEAPVNVMEELSCYIKQGGSKKMFPTVKAFIQKGVRQLDYSHALNPSRLISQGKYFDLGVIFDQLNQTYFKGKLGLNMTWFGQPCRKMGSRVVLGLYCDPLKLIKIHRLLDHAFFPDYVICFVVYHEMLHSVCPGYMDIRGFHRIHTKEFKTREKEFKYFKEAQRWIYEHRHHLFQS